MNSRMMENCSYGRPGGLALTRRMLALAPLPVGARVADIGCGGGGTVHLLRRGYSLVATGLDIALPKRAPGTLEKGDATSLPYAGGSLDALFYECSLSKMEPPETALSEAGRVLKPGGRLYVQDLYARGQDARFHGPLGRVERWDRQQQRFSEAGFRLCHFADETPALLSLWGQLVMEQGAEALCGALQADDAGLKRARCGYYVAVLARR